MCFSCNIYIFPRFDVGDQQKCVCLLSTVLYYIFLYHSVMIYIFCTSRETIFWSQFFYAIFYPLMCMDFPQIECNMCQYAFMRAVFFTVYNLNDILYHGYFYFVHLIKPNDAIKYIILIYSFKFPISYLVFLINIIHIDVYLKSILSLGHFFSSMGFDPYMSFFILMYSVCTLIGFYVHLLIYFFSLSPARCEDKSAFK